MCLHFTLTSVLIRAVAQWNPDWQSSCCRSQSRVIFVHRQTKEHFRGYTNILLKQCFFAYCCILLAEMNACLRICSLSISAVLLWVTIIHFPLRARKHKVKLQENWMLILHQHVWWVSFWLTECHLKKWCIEVMQLSLKHVKHVLIMGFEHEFKWKLPSQ